MRKTRVDALRFFSRISARRPTPRRRGREIPRLENLDKLQGVRWLDLGQNRIPRLENLSLPKLEVLDLSANQISAIPELRLPTLQRLMSAQA